MTDQRGTRWVVAAHESERAEALARNLHLPRSIARLLVCRGFDNPQDAWTFLHPSLDHFHEPGLMLGMDVAVLRLRSALAAGEPVLIYGDYDVDGTVATVLLKTAAERAAAAMGVKADIRYHIPHRIREGYGIQNQRIEEAEAEGVRLVVSVDTGIRAFTAAAEAKRFGLDLIVTDHHLPDGRGLPEAIAVLNPNQAGCPYPYKDLCGAGVAFKLAQALLESAAKDDAERKRLREKTLLSFLKLLAIATIADAVPLTGENRAIVSIGLDELRKPSQAGLKALLQLAQIDTTRAISAIDVGFRLAPRINAAGRMDIASDVVEMFLTRDAVAARTFAEKLHRLNDERRASEAEALRVIEARIEARIEAQTEVQTEVRIEAQTEAQTEARIEAQAEAIPEMPACFVLDDAAEVQDWHRGVLGILASRVVDKTARPALVITHEEGEAYGSGRSVAGFHLLDALTAVHTETAHPLLNRFGGHAHAVGFSLSSTSVAELRERLERYAIAHPGQPAAEELECDAEVALTDLTPDFLIALDTLGPFGMGNAEPLFLTYGVHLAAALKIVKDRHLKLIVEQDGARFSGMAWGHRTDWPAVALAEGWTPGSLLDLAFRMRRNWHPDFGGWELEIVGIRSSHQTQ